MQDRKLQKMTAVAVCAAMGVVLQMIAIPLIPAFPFLKMDFSDIPVLVNMFVFGPLTGIATAFVRSTIHLLMTGFSPDNLVGDIASFLATTIFTLPIFYIFKRTEKYGFKLLGLFSGISLMTVFMSIANYFVITPLYLKVFGLDAQQMLGMDLGKYILYGVTPFNLIKGVIVSAVFLVLYAKLVPWLTRKSLQVHHKHTI